MNVGPAWQKGYTGKGVVVSILDDGIQRNHPDLDKNYVSSLVSSARDVFFFCFFKFHPLGVGAEKSEEILGAVLCWNAVINVFWLGGKQGLAGDISHWRNQDDKFEIWIILRSVTAKIWEKKL